MPKIFPFKALRPLPRYIQKVSAKSSDFGSQDELVTELKNNPITFHHITKSHLTYSGPYQEPEKLLPYAAMYLEDMIKQGVLIHEDEPCFYLYEQIRSNGKRFEGVIALCDLADHRSGRIKKHEEIRPSRLKFLVELFKTTKVMGEPTLLAYEHKVDLNLASAKMLYSFTSVDGKQHIFRQISSPSEVQSLQKRMEQMDNFYIADGHHRSASTEKFHAEFPEYENGKSMCFLVHEDQLDIKAFHRLIKPIHSITKEQLIAQLKTYFTVVPNSQDCYSPTEKGHFGMYMDGEWFDLELIQKQAEMDVTILEKYIVKEIFEIADSRIDSQIAFHPFTAGIDTLTDLIDSGTFTVAFTSKECTFREVREVSDRNEVLPPKSTYIEPKLRAGMIIQQF